MKGLPYITSDPVSIFIDTLRRASEDGMNPRKPALKRLRSWRVERRLRRMLARMKPDEKERALRLAAANYAVGQASGRNGVNRDQGGASPRVPPTISGG